MRFIPGILLLAGTVLVAGAAELKFDFSGTRVSELPKHFKSMQLGGGTAGQWQVVMDELPSQLRAFTPEAAAANRRPVLAQLSTDPTDERFPILLYEKESFADFSFTTKFKFVSGKEERMAGVVFRAKDERNFYVVRADGISGNVRFYKVVDGQRSAPIGNNYKLETGVWYELAVSCKGNQISVFFEGKPLGGPMTDLTFATGKLGFWTKSDAVSYFADASLSFTPRQIMAQAIVEDTLKKYSRLVNLRMHAVREGKQQAEVVAAHHPQDLGEASIETVGKVLANGAVFHTLEAKAITMYMPLHDRNGDIVAVAEICMETFFGQTVANALSRATPIVKFMDERIQSHKDLLQ